jgi:hypothetical protein
VRSADGAVLEVDPPRVRVVAVGLRERSAAGALAHELDLLGVELGKSADAVAATDRSQVR